MTQDRKRHKLEKNWLSRPNVPVNKKIAFAGRSTLMSKRLKTFAQWVCFSSKINARFKKKNKKQPHVVTIICSLYTDSETFVHHYFFITGLFSASKSFKGFLCKCHNLKHTTSCCSGSIGSQKLVVFFLMCGSSMASRKSNWTTDILNTWKRSG